MATQHKRGRDADNGQFIPVKVAERRTRTAIVETFKTDKDGRLQTEPFLTVEGAVGVKPGGLFAVAKIR